MGWGQSSAMERVHEESLEAWVLILALSLTGCMNLGKALNLYRS